MRTDNQGKNKKPDKGSIIMLLSLVAVTVIIYCVYRLCTEVLLYTPIFFIYIGVECVLVAVYLFYNRGFSLRGVTKEMLPETMSEEEKDALLKDAELRLKRSKWMIIPIVAFMFTFAIDAIELFLLPNMEVWFGK